MPTPVERASTTAEETSGVILALSSSAADRQTGHGPCLMNARLVREVDVEMRVHDKGLCESISTLFLILVGFDVGCNLHDSYFWMSD